MKSDQLQAANIVNNDFIIKVALDKLKRYGYNWKFRREATCLYCFQLREWIMPGDFGVDEYYHFESILNPAAERLLYAISLVGGSKGFLIDTCNAYMDNISPEMAEKLKLTRINYCKYDLANAGKTKIPDKFTALAF